MRIYGTCVARVLVGAAIIIAVCASVTAQGPSVQVHGNLNDVMRGILFPNSNIIFAAQSIDPAALKADADPSLSTDPLLGLWGGWQAVENSGLALAESANLLTVPGRLCSNGRAVPTSDPGWLKFVQSLRDAGMASYKAAQSKNQERILDAADQVSAACVNCHQAYRSEAARCLIRN